MRALVIDGVTRGVSFLCPGCNERHNVRVGDGANTWNGDAQRPTLAKAVHVRSGHHAYSDADLARGRDCWCTWSAQGCGVSRHACSVCHAFVTEGRIQFLEESTHALSGETVDLPEVTS